MVVLPKHLHAIWRLPPGDADYPRWLLIKSEFSRRLAKNAQVKRERGAFTSTLKHHIGLFWQFNIYFF
jgi:REP element-mobilizing transposase RayT